MVVLINYPHLTDEETGTERLSVSPEVTQPSGNRSKSRLSDSRACGSSPVLPRRLLSP